MLGINKYVAHNQAFGLNSVKLYVVTYRMKTRPGMQFL